MTDSKSVALGHLGDTPNYRITLFSAIHYTIRLKQAQSDAVGFEPTPFFYEKIRLFAVVILLSLVPKSGFEPPLRPQKPGQVGGGRDIARLCLPRRLCYLAVPTGIEPVLLT